MYMSKLKKDSITFTKVKYLNGKVDIHYQHTLVVDGEPHVFVQNPISTVLPHPNFMAVLTNLRTRVAEIFFPADQVEAMTKRIRVNGFDITGAEGSRKVKILAMLSDNSDNSVSLNTTWIGIDGEGQYGNEDELRADIKAGFDRAYGYLFEGEKAQLDIPFKGDGDGDTNEDDKGTE